MNKPSNRDGGAGCRSKSARLRRKARPASLAIVIGSLLAVITLHAVWSNCSAENGDFFQLSDAGQSGGGRASLADFSEAVVPRAVVLASYVAEEGESLRATGVPVVTPDTYRPDSARSQETAERREIWGATVAPRVVPSRLMPSQAGDHRDVQPFPEVVITPPESRRSIMARTTHPAPPPAVSVRFAGQRCTSLQPEPSDSVFLPARADSAAVSDANSAEPASSIRVADRDRIGADRPTRWKIEARPPVDGDLDINVAAGMVAPEQVAPPIDEIAAPHKTISMRLRGDGADRAADGVPQTLAPEQDTLASPEGTTRTTDDAESSAPLREVLPIRWTIGGQKTARPEDVAQQDQSVAEEVYGPASTSASNVPNNSAPQAEVARLRIGSGDRAPSRAVVDSSPSAAPKTDSTRSGWSTQDGDSSGRLRLVYEDQRGRDTSAPPAHEPPERPALRLAAEETVPPATGGSGIRQNSDGESTRNRRISCEFRDSAEVDAPVADLAGPAPTRDDKSGRNALSPAPLDRSPAAEEPAPTRVKTDGWVAVPAVQHQQPTDDLPPRPPMDVLARKSPDVPSVGDSLAERFTQNIIGWKVVPGRETASTLAATDGGPAKQTQPENPLDGDRPPATKDPAPTSGGRLLTAKPAAPEGRKSNEKPRPSRLVLRYDTGQPEPPPDDPSRPVKDNTARDAAVGEFARNFGPRDLADVFALSRGEPVVPAVRNDSLAPNPAENRVPFAFDDGEKSATHPQTAVWRPDDTSAAEDRAEAAAPVESLSANSQTREPQVIPLAVAQAREDVALPSPDVDDRGTGTPAAVPGDTPKLLVHGMAAKPISRVNVDITPPVDESPLGSEFPDEVRLPWDPTGEAPLVDESFTRGWCPSDYSWAATGLCHRPLYFEQVNLERYGYAPTRSRTGQSILAGAHFFGSALILPYRLGAEPINECVYTLGHYRPGSCVPYRTEWPPLDWKGGALETITLTGLIFAIP